MDHPRCRLLLLRCVLSFASSLTAPDPSITDPLILDKSSRQQFFSALLRLSLTPDVLFFREFDFELSQEDRNNVVDLFVEVLAMSETRIWDNSRSSKSTWFTTQIPWLTELALYLDTTQPESCEPCPRSDHFSKRMQRLTQLMGWIAECLLLVGSNVVGSNVVGSNAKGLSSGRKAGRDDGDSEWNTPSTVLAYVHDDRLLNGPSDEGLTSSDLFQGGSIFWSNIFEQNIDSLASDGSIQASILNFVSGGRELSKECKHPYGTQLDSSKDLLKQSLREYRHSRQCYDASHPKVSHSTHPGVSHSSVAGLIVTFVESLLCLTSQPSKRRRIEAEAGEIDKQGNGRDHGRGNGKNDGRQEGRSRKFNDSRKVNRENPISGSLDGGSMDNERNDTYHFIMHNFVSTAMSIWAAALTDSSTSSSTRQQLMELLERFGTEQCEAGAKWKIKIALMLAKYTRRLERLCYGPPRLARIVPFFGFDSKFEVSDICFDIWDVIILIPQK